MRIKPFARLLQSSALTLFMFAQSTAFATGGADVLDVQARQTAPQAWYFSVTIKHPDTGWDHYADGWDVVLPDGSVVKPAGGEFTRTLVHPHVDEQPFTRSQSGVKIPAGVKRVTVRAHVIPDGYVGKTRQVDVTP